MLLELIYKKIDKLIKIEFNEHYKNVLYYFVKTTQFIAMLGHPLTLTYTRIRDITYSSFKAIFERNSKIEWSE